MPNLSGTVYRYGTDERVRYASIKAISKGKSPEHVITDDDGDFTFENLSVGKWTLIALDEKSLPGKHKEIQLTKDKANIKIELQRFADTTDLKSGNLFFKSILIAFGLLVLLYSCLHIFLKPEGTLPTDTFFWNKGLWRYLELLMWGFAGILVNKIIICGWYLRAKRFYREGIVMHISHLVTTPFLVLIAVAILSLAKITITMANSNEVTLDLSNPDIMVAAAFLLGSSPWPLWEFIQDSAKKIIG